MKEYDFWTQKLENLASEAGETFKEFIKTIAALRHPETGCPWDLEQDHQSLSKYLIEESYEALNAILSRDDADMSEELGDVLLQVVLHAQLGGERDAFDIGSVVEGINQKMKRRHPHVFGPKGSSVTKQQVKENWQKIKQQEKGSKPMDPLSELEKMAIPAALKAVKIGKLTKKEDFDWSEPGEVFDQFRSEVDELNEAMAQGKKESIAEELGDVYFSLAQLARHLGQDPEIIGEQANRKFLKRYRQMKDKVSEDGKSFVGLERDT